MFWYPPNWCFQRAPTNGAGAASRAVLVDGHTSALTHRSITIVADGLLEVCDGDQRMFVMKKGSTQLPVSSWKRERGFRRTALFLVWRNVYFYIDWCV